MFSQEQLDALNAIGQEIGQAVGIERKRLSKQLKQAKYKFRKENWRT